jgi:hypothetical protein
MAWFPLESADVLVSFPPRLAAMPRFVRALRETFASVLEEVLWPSGRPCRLVFREEGFLVSVPALYRDLQLDARADRDRYYWVMDFGGGTTDVCGFLCRSLDGDEHVVSRMTYPQRLPHHQRVRDGAGKWVLREALARHVPRDLFERPKAGFAPPLGAWLRGPLADWADGLLAPDAVDPSLLDAAEVARLWRTHRSGRYDMSRDLWPLLMFQAWQHA